MLIDFQTDPERYRHWRLSCNGRVATLALAVDEAGGIHPGYELKLNSYDLGVDIELYDASQRLRFEHPEVAAVILTSARERIFCAGANIRMLAQSEHGFKVNFCKFTNETRNALEDASANSGQRYLALINGPCAGGGYELALATDYLIMADDGSTSVSLPEVPLLAVLPGTGGLTRLVDKRRVRRDRADFFCTTEEGVRGARAVEWRLVDEVAPRTQLADAAERKAREFAAMSPRPAAATGVRLCPLTRKIEAEGLTYSNLIVEIDRDRAIATLTIRGPRAAAGTGATALDAVDDTFWPLALARELDDAMLHLRFNETAVGTWLFRTQGDGRLVESYDHLLSENRGHWLAREITLYLKRTLKRLEVSSRSIFALIEPGSCYAGSLFEIALAADRAYMLSGIRDDVEVPAARVLLTPMNFGPLTMCNGLTRLASRFLDDPARVAALQKRVGEELAAERALELELIGFAPDAIDWDDEVRVALEERAAFSPDALTAMEASLRFAGPETMESKIFARLSAWQNWLFQRPNAVGENGALKRYGSGRRATFDPRRV
ncbi:MAG TPA: 2,3-epoxybenzoyl-CoA dihydrolase [Candidatus Binataceae bacterium]|nr:2,3-epoxybenzoyl-CoA dihydrolase [Candidatus Binataceae bacterium]